MFSAVGWICVQEAAYQDEFGDRNTFPRQPTLDAVTEVLDRLVPPTFVVRSHETLRSQLSALLGKPEGQTDPHLPRPGPEALFRSDNGTWTVIIDTHRNHRRDWPQALFREVGRVAPGSFGFMHIWDDEHPTESEKFMRWTMVLGAVSVQEEEVLRPIMRLMLDTPDADA